MAALLCGDGREAVVEVETENLASKVVRVVSRCFDLAAISGCRLRPW